MHALIIEDSMSVRRIIKGILMSELGFESVTEAENGQLGLDELTRSCFGYDLVVLDWYMPIMDGIDALLNIRERNKSIPVIICTSAGDKESIINAVTAGANEYIIKPFNAMALENKVNKVLGIYQEQRKNISSNTILIADDSAIIRSAMRKSIEQDPSFDIIVEACDGVEALNLFKSQQFKLVILDWQMPNLDGIDALKEMRIINKTTPIIMVTGNSSSEHMVEAFDAGATNFIPKPFTKDQLLNTLHLSMVTTESAPNISKNNSTFDLDTSSPLTNRYKQ
ncbi:MAG: response regulator [Fibrobacterales bacterium]